MAAMPVMPVVRALAKSFAVWLVLGLERLQATAHWVSRHTGIPVIVVSAIAIVLLCRVARLAKRSVRFAFQVCLVLGVLALLGALGILRF